MVLIIARHATVNAGKSIPDRCAVMSLAAAVRRLFFHNYHS